MHKTLFSILDFPHPYLKNPWVLIPLRIVWWLFLGLLLWMLPLLSLCFSLYWIFSLDFQTHFLSSIISPKNPDPDALQFLLVDISSISSGLWTLVVLLGFPTSLYYYGREAKKRRKTP